MSNSIEATREMIQDSAALIDKYYAQGHGDHLRRVLGTLDEAIAEQERRDAEGVNQRKTHGKDRDKLKSSREALREVVSIIKAAKVDGFDKSKNGRDEAVKVLHQLRELVEGALHGDDDEKK